MGTWWVHQLALAFMWLSLALMVEVNSTQILLAVTTDSITSLLNKTLHLSFQMWYVVMFEGPSSYCHGAVILVKECILEGGLHDPFGICGACPPFYENYLSDIGSHYAILGHVPNVFCFPTMWACQAGIFASKPSTCWESMAAPQPHKPFEFRVCERFEM
jgi:hypothetical protein